MLQKLRSRHPIDLPVDENWGTRKPTGAILGIVAALFLLLPLVGALYLGVLGAPLAIALGAAVLVLALLVGGLVGKPGWRRG